MWSAAAVGHTLDDAAEYCWDGITAGDKSFNWAKMKEKRDAYVNRLSGIYYNNVARDNIYLIRGEAAFAGDNVLKVKPVPGIEEFKKTDNAELNQRVVYVEGEDLVFNIGDDGNAKKVLIACGGAPAKLNIPGGEYAINSDGFFWLTEQPKKALIIGGGYVGVELSHLLHALGTEVGLACRGGRALMEFDELVTTTLWSRLTNLPGFDAMADTTCKSIVKGDDGLYTVTFETPEGDVVKGGYDTIISAIGRTAGATLNLRDTSIKLDRRGCIEVDDIGLSSLPNVYAVGDIIGKADLTPVAINAGRRLADYLFGGKPRDPLEYHNIPTVDFTYPPIAACGLTEKQARAKYGDAVKVYKSVFTPMYYSMLTHKDTCAMKLIVQGPEERIIGIHMTGLGVDEMMQGFAVCVKLGLKKSEMDSVVAIHPTASEELVLMR